MSLERTEMMDDKPRTEVIEETRETLSVLELDRKPRSEKLAAERAFFDGAHEVRLTERTFRPKHDAALDEIRAFVDSLEVRRHEVPSLPVLAPMHVEARPQVPEHYRAPLERAIRGTLVSVETVHRVGTGTVVDVAWEPRDGGLQRALFLVVEDEARPYSDVASKIDGLAPPAAPRQLSGPDRPEAPLSSPPEKKRILGFGKRKETPGPEPVDSAPKAEDEPKKRRFGFGKK
jgi:hypothetical protein